MREPQSKGAPHPSSRPTCGSLWAQARGGAFGEEEGFYRAINEGHRKHFAAMDLPVGSVGIAASDRSDLLEALAPYHSALDLPIVRVLADATLLSAVADTAAP